MKIVKLLIDEKSLYLNINNDNQKGHTPTVSTAIKQGRTLNKNLEQIYKIPKQVGFIPDEFRKELLKNSKSVIKIQNVFCFNKISANGILIDNDASFCMYVKEEVDESKVQYGRIKLHYPRTLIYDDGKLQINNKDVLRKVSKALNNYAFIVKAFEFDYDTEILNFDCEIVGPKDTLYSKIFVNYKGSGSKFTQSLITRADNYDLEARILKTKDDLHLTPANFAKIMEKNKDEMILKYIETMERDGFQDIKYLSKEYKYCEYDVEANKNGVKFYFMFFNTASKIIYCDVSISKLQFITFFNDKSIIVCITGAFDEPKYNVFKIKDLDRFKREVMQVRLML